LSHYAPAQKLGVGVIGQGRSGGRTQHFMIILKILRKIDFSAYFLSGIRSHELRNIEIHCIATTHVAKTFHSENQKINALQAILFERKIRLSI
jgi:hypothetical protein